MAWLSFCISGAVGEHHHMTTLSSIISLVLTPTLETGGPAITSTVRRGLVFSDAPI